MKTIKITLRYTYINLNKPDLICLSETWSSQTKKCRVYGYNFVEEFRPNGYGGVAIGVANHIQFKKLKIPANGEIVAINTLNTEKPLNIVSVYFTPTLDKALFEQDVTMLLTKFRNTNTIICGDFNAITKTNRKVFLS